MFIITLRRPPRSLHTTDSIRAPISISIITLLRADPELRLRTILGPVNRVPSTAVGRIFHIYRLGLAVLLSSNRLQRCHLSTYELLIPSQLSLHLRWMDVETVWECLLQLMGALSMSGA